MSKSERNRILGRVLNQNKPSPQKVMLLLKIEHHYLHSSGIGYQNVF